MTNHFKIKAYEIQIGDQLHLKCSNIKLSPVAQW